MIFEVDYRIKESGFLLYDWPLSSIFLKNEKKFPWLILVPRVENIQEIYQLNEANLNQLMAEIAKASELMKGYFNPDKLNIGALGNIVSQLHVHIVARFQDDKAWPHGIWQPTLTTDQYNNEQADQLITALQAQLAEAKF